jgi:hypothetical protein
MPIPPDETPRANRFRTGLSAEVHYGSDTVHCDVSNLSRTGVFLAGLVPRTTEGPVHLTLKSTTGDLEVRLTGRVVRQDAATSDAPGGVAVEFHPPEAPEKAKLDALVARVIGGSNPSPIQNLRQGMPMHELRKALEAIPLSDRIATATRAVTPKDREILRCDSHPLVLQALARNSNLSLDDARALASQPHALPGLLEMLAADGRFKQDDELKVLLLSHPQCPPGAADAMIAVLRTPLIRRLLARPSLSPIVRTKVNQRLRQSR